MNICVGSEFQWASDRKRGVKKKDVYKYYKTH